MTRDEGHAEADSSPASQREQQPVPRLEDQQKTLPRDEQTGTEQGAELHPEEAQGLGDLDTLGASRDADCARAEDSPLNRDPLAKQGSARDARAGCETAMVGDSRTGDCSFAIDVGDKIDKYEIKDVIGRGGQAVTVKAWDPDTARHVVLKLYHGADCPEEQRAVVDEGRKLAKVHSPYLPKCHGVERLEGSGFPYLVIEYIPGRDLSHLHQPARLSERKCLDIVAQIAEGLATMHARGLLHRDVKPSNIVVGDDEVPRLIDLGLCKPFGDAALAHPAGTFQYMAPEQARGEMERVDHRIDIFGLGGTLYFLLTGAPPFEGTTRQGVYEAACRGDVTPPRQRNSKISRSTNSLCMKCLAKSPDGRFDSAKELAECIRKQTRSRRLIPIVALLSLACLIVLGVALKNRFTNPTAPPQETTTAPPQETTTALRAGLFEVQHYRGNPARHMGTIGRLSHSGREDDHVRVSIHLSAPAYCYLLALNPNGTVQMCPKAQSNVRPIPVTEIDYPAEADRYYGLTDGAGLQAFVLIASRDPLPAFDSWPHRTALSWKPSAGAVGVWRSHGSQFELLASNTRGDERQVATMTPRSVTDVYDFLREIPGLDLVEVVAFPVEPMMLDNLSRPSETRNREGNGAENRN